MTNETTEAATADAANATPIIPRLLTLKLLRKHFLPAGERTINRMVSEGKFPKHDIVMSNKAKFWLRETVEAWIADRAGLAA